MSRPLWPEFALVCYRQQGPHPRHQTPVSCCPQELCCLWTSHSPNRTTDDGSVTQCSGDSQSAFQCVWGGLCRPKKGHTRKLVIVKAYLAVFVCFSSKAAHLEVVSDLTTEAFLAYLRRFVSRRGLPAHIHSDNGGNFRGAKNDLRELYILLEKNSTQSTIQSYLLSQKVQWHFSTERAPHFGGLWEAAVKSAKRHLKRVIGTQRLNFEEFSTISAQVESCLNSRPLLATTSHSTDGIKTLTPGHFLIGREMCLPRTYHPNRPIPPSPMEPLPGHHLSFLEVLVPRVPATIAETP